MKKGLENIEEVFKQTFEGFEANVDPSVWNNIQSSIASGNGAGTSVKPKPGTSSVVGKSFALKLVAGVLAITSIATGVYFIANNPKAENEQLVNSYVVSDDSEPELKSLSVDEQDVKVGESFKDIKSNLTEKVLEVPVSLEQVNVAIAQEAVASEVNDIVSSFEEETAFTDEYVEEDNIQKYANEEMVEPTIDKNQPNIDVLETVDLKGDILASVVKGDAPLDVDFEVEGENIVSYSWDFGDNSAIDKEESVFHTFEDPGKYKVELIILDENANSKSYIKYIEVEDPMKATLGFVQNAFSPNGDGHNDVYKLTAARNIKTFNAQVRRATNGKLVYEWNSITEGWIGDDFSGKKLELGSYSLSIRAIGTDGKVIVRNLIITIY